MRIVGGEARGRRLKAPEGQGTRPTADRVRETLFNILGQRLHGVDAVLDLYAGSGALSLEALSRGASRALMVEKDRRAADVCRENAESLGYGGRVEIVRGDAVGSLGRLRGRRFHLVFLDPPYVDSPDPALEILGQGESLSDDATVVLEHDKRISPQERYGVLVRTDSRRFGDTVVSFYERSQQEPP